MPFGSRVSTSTFCRSAEEASDIDTRTCAANSSFASDPDAGGSDPSLVVVLACRRDPTRAEVRLPDDIGIKPRTTCVMYGTRVDVLFVEKVIGDFQLRKCHAW